MNDSLFGKFLLHKVIFVLCKFGVKSAGHLKRVTHYWEFTVFFCFRSINTYVLSIRVTEGKNWAAFFVSSSRERESLWKFCCSHLLSIRKSVKWVQTRILFIRTKQQTEIPSRFFTLSVYFSGKRHKQNFSRVGIYRVQKKTFEYLIEAVW